MRVLVTGAAGYIGSHALREFRDAGHELRALDDLSRGHRAAVPADVPLIVGDVGEAGLMARALEGVDAVVHFAGLLSVAESVAQPGPYYRTNVAKGVALLESMAAAGVRRIIFSSTCAVYGMPIALPMDETHPQDPINPYGATKRAFERALADHAAAGALRAVALRYFNAAGCRLDGSLGEDHRPEEHLIPLAIDAALGRRPELVVHGDDYDTPDGTCVRDYVHVQDLAVAHVRALEGIDEGDAFRAYNLGSEHGHSVRQVLDSVERVSGRRVPSRVGPRRPGDPPRLVASARKLRDEMGFSPVHRELDGIVESALRWRLVHAGGYAG